MKIRKINEGKAITLIALVITIIVLLILAGVALSLVVGEDGITNRAITAAKTQDIAGAKEELELLAASYAGDFYEAKYITGATEATSLGDYVASKFTPGIFEENFTLTIDANDSRKITISSKNYSDNSATCTINDDGEVVWEGGDPDPIEEVKPDAESEPDSDVTFALDYGTIDVIWLSGQTNTRSATPNDPTSHLGGMTKVTWSENNDYSATEDSTASSNWYSYTAGTGTDDNRASHWANAKNGDSYFVWIPRYAYRITYYDKDPSDENAQVTGYYDGYGMWKADGSKKYALDSGIETASYNGKKYIVHPAFETSLDNGGWSTDLEGFWVAKYEMSRTGAIGSNAGSGYNTTFKSVPGVSSARSIKIGDMYDVSLAFDSSKESHLMKNSEWGAVAYLTHSQYGRNGHEIDINNQSSYITGIGSGSTSASLSSDATNVYNSAIGTKASTTGNVYGIYDMSGGAMEYVAGFYKQGNSNLTGYGWSALSSSTSSTKYATAYDYDSQDVSNHNETDLGGKIGDATKEVKAHNEWHQYGGHPVDVSAWNNDCSYFVDSGSPFFCRGGGYYSGADVGVFCASSYAGRSDVDSSFRVVLCP